LTENTRKTGVQVQIHPVFITKLRTVTIRIVTAIVITVAAEKHIRFPLFIKEISVIASIIFFRFPAGELQIKLTFCTSIRNGQDACSTKSEFSCGVDILPDRKGLIENGVRLS
jgi:hypothetical protein